MRILVCDDSLVYRSQIKLVLGAESGFEVVKTAVHGQDAIDYFEGGGAADLVVIDVKMPVLNGIDTVIRLRELGYKQPIIVFAAQTASSVESTIKALGAGADDFVIKPDGSSSSYEESVEQIRIQLVPRILQFLKNGATAPSGTSLRSTPQKWPQIEPEHQRATVCVIASSTGGPAALEEMIKDIPGPAKVPILIVQHMPPVFTKSLANRLNQLTDIEVCEATHNEPLRSGRAYLAPGDFHMTLMKNPSGIYIQLNQNDRRHSVRPCAEFLFESAVEIFGRGVFGVVMTGMGEDGRDGCGAIKSAGGCVVIQDAATSVVWGMPGAVHNTGAYDKVLSLQELGPLIQTKISVLAGKKKAS